MIDPLLAGGLVVVAVLLGIGGTYLVVRRAPRRPRAKPNPTPK